MCRAEYGGKLPDNRIDLAALDALDQIWETRGDTFNFVSATKNTMWLALQDTARAGRARPLMVGGNITFFRDQKTSLTRASFMPRDIRRGTFNVEYVMLDDEAPDDVIIEFFNRDTWTWDEVQCSLPDSTSGAPARIRLNGVDNRNQAYREGMYESAANRYRRIFAKFQTELKGRMLRSGDLVSVSHPLPAWGESGELAHFETEEGGVSLFANNELTWKEGVDHCVSLCRPNGSMWGPCKVTQGAAADEMVLDPTEYQQILTDTGDDPFDETTGWAFVGFGQLRTGYQFGEQTNWARLCRVVHMRPGSKMDEAEVYVVVENDLVHTADEGTPAGSGGDPEPADDSGLPGY